MLIVQAMLCGEEGLFFLSLAPVGRFPSTPLGIVREHTAPDPGAGHRENIYFFNTPSACGGVSASSLSLGRGVLTVDA
jgi:hypothetical protein